MANVCDGKDNVLSKAALKLDIGMEDDGYDSASSSETNLLSQQVRGYFQQPKIAIFSSSFFLHLFSSTKSRLEMGAGKGGECLKKFSFDLVSCHFTFQLYISVILNFRPAY